MATLDVPPTDTERHLRDALDAAETVIARLKAAVLDIDAHATPFGEDEDGFVDGGYLVTTGSLHRALGVVGHGSRKCSRCPHPHEEGTG